MPSKPMLVSIGGAVAGAIVGVIAGAGGPVLEAIVGGAAGYFLAKNSKLFPVALVFLVTTGCFGMRVDETELCTETQWGNAVTPIMHKGWNWQISPGLDGTCFPATQQIYPGGLDKHDQPNAETVAALTRDSVDLTLEFAFEHQINPTFYYDSVFKTKRDMSRFEATVTNAAREGARATIGTWRSGAALTQREEFGDSLKRALQRSLGGLTKVTRVYVRGMDLPPKVREAREAVFQQNMAEQQALKQRRIDSVGNVTKIQNANTEYEIRRVNARVFENKVFAEIEVKKAQAQALGSICGEASTCIIGGNVMDKFMAGAGEK